MYGAVHGWEELLFLSLSLVWLSGYWVVRRLEMSDLVEWDGT